jgi:hypothetical protein
MKKHNYYLKLKNLILKINNNEIWAITFFSSDNRRLDRSKSNAKGKVVAARVLDIVLDEKHKDYGNVGGQWNGIGAIFYEIVNKSGTKSYPNFALPYDSQLKTYPLVNEIVLLISLPNQSIGLYHQMNHIFI